MELPDAVRVVACHGEREKTPSVSDVGIKFGSVALWDAQDATVADTGGGSIDGTRYADVSSGGTHGEGGQEARETSEMARVQAKREGEEVAVDTRRENEARTTNAGESQRPADENDVRRRSKEDEGRFSAKTAKDKSALQRQGNGSNLRPEDPPHDGIDSTGVGSYRRNNTALTQPVGQREENGAATSGLAQRPSDAVDDEEGTQRAGEIVYPRGQDEGKEPSFGGLSPLAGAALAGVFSPLSGLSIANDASTTCAAVSYINATAARFSRRNGNGLGSWVNPRRRHSLPPDPLTASRHATIISGERNASTGAGETEGSRSPTTGRSQPLPLKEALPQQSVPPPRPTPPPLPLPVAMNVTGSGGKRARGRATEADVTAVQRAVESMSDEIANTTVEGLLSGGAQAAAAVAMQAATAAVELAQLSARLASSAGRLSIETLRALHDGTCPYDETVKSNGPPVSEAACDGSYRNGLLGSSVPLPIGSSSNGKLRIRPFANGPLQNEMLLKSSRQNNGARITGLPRGAGSVVVGERRGRGLDEWGMLAALVSPLELITARQRQERDLQVRFSMGAPRPRPKSVPVVWVTVGS